MAVAIGLHSVAMTPSASFISGYGTTGMVAATATTTPPVAYGTPLTAICKGAGSLATATAMFVNSYAPGAVRRTVSSSVIPNGVVMLCSSCDKDLIYECEDSRVLGRFPLPDHLHKCCDCFDAAVLGEPVAEIRRQKEEKRKPKSE